MSRRHLAGVLTVVGVFASVACSDQSPVAPPRTPDGASLAAQTAPGTYVLSFLASTNTGLVPVADGTAVPVGTYLVLKSEVRDNSGNLAQAGSVTYEYCSLQGDPAPAAQCDSGSGSWSHIMMVRVDPIGSLVGWGSCSSPRTIGFRFRYTAKGSGIASGVSLAKDFTWEAIV
jgi:hypothetical protein